MGGGVYMDVLENKIVPIDCDFDSLGLALCLTDTGDNSLPEESTCSQIAADMSAVAQQFGEPVLARVRRPVFDEQWPAIIGEGSGDSLARCLEASGNLLAGRGAWRVHSGGFAGFVLALMPEMHFELYMAGMDKLFGAGACQRIHISPRGVCLAQEDKALFNGRGFPEEAAPLG